MNFYTKTVYKKDSKEKIRIAKITADNGKLTIETGLLEGKLVKNESLSKPKNVGKKNERDSSQQAIFEAKAKVKKKLKEGYFETKELAENNKSLKPMLAKDYKDFKDSITFPCIVQPKLDGVRALKTKSDTFKSRKNTPIETVKHLNCDTGKEVLDGELYLHNTSFQNIASYVSKETEDSKKLMYYVYDVVMDKNYKERYKYLSLLNLPDNYILVENKIANSLEEIDKIYDEFVKQGYEGAMVRYGEESYQIDKRSKNLLKYKRFIDRDYEIVDIVPANKRPTWGVPVCKLDFELDLTTKGVTFLKDSEGEDLIVRSDEDGTNYGIPTVRCGTKLSVKEREELLQNKGKYIGKKAEVRFFEFYDSGIPRFPKYYGYRIDK